MMNTDKAKPLNKNQHPMTLPHIEKINTKVIGSRPLLLSKRMTIEQAFQTIVFHCIEQIEVHATGIAHQYDAESLHQMRVGLRRLRV